MLSKIERGHVDISRFGLDWFIRAAEAYEYPVVAALYRDLDLEPPDVALALEAGVARPAESGRDAAGSTGAGPGGAAIVPAAASYVPVRWLSQAGLPDGRQSSAVRPGEGPEYVLLPGASFEGMLVFRVDTLDEAGQGAGGPLGADDLLVVDGRDVGLAEGSVYVAVESGRAQGGVFRVVNAGGVLWLADVSSASRMVSHDQARVVGRVVQVVSYRRL